MSADSAAGKMLLAAAVFLGTAVFAATGVLASARRKMDCLGAIVLAVVTACGGLIRDVLSAQVPSVLRQSELYAAAAIPGALLFVAFQHLPVTPAVVATVCIGSVLLVRFAAMR